MATNQLTKTGECHYRDEAGAIWLAQSWLNEETGEVTTTDTLIEPAPAADPAAPAGEPDAAAHA